MTLRNVFRLPCLLAGAVVFILTSGCGSEADGDEGETPETDSTKTSLLNVEGELFSIPSPIQTAFLIKQIGTNFNASLLNDPKKVSAYTTSFKRALNLGVYGADLGYVTLYDKTQDALSIMTAVRKLGDDLGISGAFDKTLLEKFNKNIGNKDSVLVLVSDAYRASDAFLKQNERSEISGLVLAGGWIESLYFSTRVVTENNNDEIKRRIAEQKSSLRGIIKILGKTGNDDTETTKLMDGLTDLSTVFEQVEFKYIYEKPTVQPEKKLTIVNGRTEIKITPGQIQAITAKVEAIRKLIIE